MNRAEVINHQGAKAQRNYTQISPELERIGKEIVDCAFLIHKEMGPGLLESVYQDCFEIALTKKGLSFERQKPVYLSFLGETIKDPFKLDLLVEGNVIIELKSVDRMNPVFEAQLISYMKLCSCRLGYLINFHVPLIKEGIFRRVL